MGELKEYVESLDTALLAFMAGDGAKIKEHKARYDIPTHPNAAVERLSLLKAVTAKRTLPLDVRRQAKIELEAAGMKSLDDGDL